MMRLALMFMVVLCTSCGGKPETLVDGGYDEEEMSRAIARARSEVDTFIAVLENRSGSDFAVKVPIEDKGKTEHFWLTDVSHRDGKFTGQIGNDPGLVTNVKFGQTITVTKGEISDWLYMREGKMYGNYTLRPLLATMPPEEAARFKAMLADP
jgi:uncharacterized protein YegJ (DUF2314 family)